MHVVVHCNVDPPAITTVEVTGRCTNDFTVSWTAASNEEGLSYIVSLLSAGMPNTTYTVFIVSRLRTPLITPCLGIPYTTMVTTLSVEEGVPQSELIVMHYMYL